MLFFFLFFFVFFLIFFFFLYYFFFFFLYYFFFFYKNKISDIQLYKISKKKLNLRQLVIGNWYRRRGKNVTAIVMLALGIFVVIVVGANFVDSVRDGHLKSSGTGGFEYYAETSLNFPKQLKIREVDAGSIVSLRKLVGDDASCLNLNFITQPQVLGVNPV